MTQAAYGVRSHPPFVGLTTSEATARARRGLANVDTTPQRTDAEVIRNNAFTLFNVVLASLILALFVLAIVDRNLGHFQDGAFVGIVVAANVAVATYQELRATRTLRGLVALTALRATVVRDGVEDQIIAYDVVQGDLIRLKLGDQVVADGRIVAGVAEIDASLLTGESEPVRKVEGDELLSGSFCVGGSCFYTADRVGAEAYALRLVADSRQPVRRLTPLQMRFNSILRALLVATGLLAVALMISYNVEDRGFAESIKATVATITSVVPEGLLLGITVAFAVGAVRVSRYKAIVQEISMVEALNYVDVVCLDKTGTITANRLTLRDARWLPSEAAAEPWLGAFAVATVGESKTADALAEAFRRRSNGAQPDGSVPFTSQRRWSAVRLRLGSGESRVFVLGAPETILRPGHGADELRAAFDAATADGLRGVVFAELDELPQPDLLPVSVRPLALLTLADVLRPQVRSAFATMESLGIEPKLISGDNPEGVAALVKQIGIRLKGGVVSGAELDRLDPEAFAEAVEEGSVFGRIAPAQKARIISTLRQNGHFVAMIGDGANDVRALRAADVAVAMASGTQTARAVAGIVLLNNSFEAFVRGTKEAQMVLGNAARLSKLFLAKSFYAYAIVVATSMLGLDFPFLPRHGSLTALLSLGIPAVFIAISTPPPESGRDFTRSVLRFALPASVALAVAAVSVHLFTQGLLDRPIEEARTLVSLTVGLTGLAFMVEVVGFEGASFRGLRGFTRPVLTILLGALLVVLFLMTLYTSWLRLFFDFTEVGVDQWAIVAPAVAGALIGQYLISQRWTELVDFLLARPGPDDIARGRAI